jgi:hypothetical protein
MGGNATFSLAKKSWIYIRKAEFSPPKNIFFVEK